MYSFIGPLHNHTFSISAFTIDLQPIGSQIFSPVGRVTHLHFTSIDAIIIGDESIIPFNFLIALPFFPQQSGSMVKKHAPPAYLYLKINY